MAPHAIGESENVDSFHETPEHLEKNKADSGQAGYRSLPVPNPCLSYWHRTTRAFQHLNANDYTPVPKTSKYAIIGSGLSGSLTAWSLVVDHNINASDILILEAREAVSGASGRNAGHVRPDAFRGFSAYSKIHGPEQAKKIIANEKLAFERVAAFVREHNVPCDFNDTTTFDVCLTPEFVAYQKESFQAYKDAGGDVSHVRYYEGEEARAKSGVEAALAAYEWPAGSSHPAKLGQWLLHELVRRGVGLWTHCAANEVNKHESVGTKDAARWDVVTARGTVATEVVVHCTNAYAAHLLPELSGFVTPNRAQAHAIVPGSELSGAKAMMSTMSLRYSLKHFFSFIQRKLDGAVVFGVSRENPGWSEKTKGSIATFDDTAYNEEIEKSAWQAYKSLFVGDHTSVARHGEGIDHSWTGIIAMTPDSVPMVGEVEGKDGQFILAGHNGHGMARIWTCAPGLASIIVGQPWSSTGLPECFEYSKARLWRVAEKEVKSVW
ncbi:Putative FAD dependent oxidoreductase, FAD/NAD(P)-binding domain superfamily [Septoria linicola]|uniref:FAD dependent oxidoreductase, FAD/NAD(P)-binding domain superfamily n=1 Tax=Septoria linicola TaxID=215465 RepID=A0A9Q9AX09_9PEZI|nr:Putative FAD dependent oxidoreductase, FAD/NAD(P)-binding domain superfamily [Septoria linicola]